MPYSFNATSYLSYVTTNANNNFLLACATTVDNTQVGGAGIYASQVLPTNSSQASFGGSQNYTFPASVLAPSGGYFAGSAGAATTGGALTFGSNVGAVTQTTIASNNGSAAGGIFANLFGVFAQPSGFNAFSVDTLGDAGTSRNLNVGGAVQQTVGATTYTVPYDAQSTSANTNTHIEHGNLATVSGSNLTCSNPHSFTKAYSAAPTVIVSLSGSTGIVGTPFSFLVSTTSMEVCYLATSGTASYFLNWVAIGE